jgi:hypothetical protein
LNHVIHLTSLKNKVYRTNTHTEEEWKENMYEDKFGSSSGRTFGEFQPI